MTHSNARKWIHPKRGTSLRLRPSKQPEFKEFRYRGLKMRPYFGVTRFLATTTAMTAGVLPSIFLTAGLVAGSATNALADDPVLMPLEHIKDPGGNNIRLGIRVGIGGSAPRVYMFDTGSDQFNAQIDPKATVTPTGELEVYPYGDGTYGYLVQKVQAQGLSYYDADGKSVHNSKPGLIIGKTVDAIYTKTSAQLKLDKTIRLSTEEVKDSQGNILKDRNGDPFYADLNAREMNQNGQPGESDGTFGTFGAGDFLSTGSANSSALGGDTKTGYIIAANANLDQAATPGCAPCTILNLNSNVRAQFSTFIPWNVKPGDGSRPNFPGSDAPASTQFEGEYTYTFKFTVAGVEKSVSVNGPILLDTGTPNEVFLTQKGAIAALEKEGLVLKENNDTDDQNGKIESFLVKKAGEDASVFEFKNIKLSRQSGETKGNGIILGLPFFHSNSVMYDLEQRATAYTPLFVSADNFTTDVGTNGQKHLGRITTKMGNYGLLGIAGIISGSGSLTLDPRTFVRMTNANTYTGATSIGNEAYLSLAGLGSIEHSSKVIADGTLDISQKGNANAFWGISDSENIARIRSLGGGSTGTVQLGNRTLTLTAANDTFAGSITDLDNQKKSWGGQLLIAGGVQTLSGKNDFSGMTTVNAGAGLRLAETGSITHDVTTSGVLGNDGQVGGSALASAGGIVAGAGRYGMVTIAGGGIVAPGSALDSRKTVSVLTVDGNFVQQSGSLYQAELATSADLIEIGGNATIENGAQIELLRQGTASVDTRYTLLTAAGGVAGIYGLTGTLVGDSPFVDFALTYDAKNVYLDTSRTNTAFADVAETFNQRSTAKAASALGAGNPINANILFLTRLEARNAFNQLSGEIHASVQSALTDDSHFVRDAASDRIRSAFDGVNASAVTVTAYGPGGPELVPATSERFAVWGSAFGAWGRLDGDGNAASLKRSNGGFMVGGDAAVAENWRLGLLTGYSHTSFDADERSASGSSKNYHLGLYAGTQHGNFGFRSGLAYTWHRIKTQRSVAFPSFSDSLSSVYDAGTFQAFGELGYRVDTASASFEPYANLAYVNLDTGEFTEKGGAAALSSEGRSSNTTFTTLGLRASTGLSLGSVQATARGGLAWRHAFGDRMPGVDVAFTNGSFFAVEGTPIARNAALIEAGLDMNLTEQATLGIAYQGQLASGAQEHGFNAKLAVRF
nr:autotransporter domain-containing protein [Mesorhizobium loti]